MNLGKKSAKMPQTRQSQVRFHDIATNAMSIFLSVGALNYTNGNAEVSEEPTTEAEALTLGVTVIGNAIVEFVPAFGLDLSVFLVGAAVKRLHDTNRDFAVTKDIICQTAALINAVIAASTKNISEEYVSSNTNGSSQI